MSGEIEKKDKKWGKKLKKQADIELARRFTGRCKIETKSLLTNHRYDLF